MGALNSLITAIPSAAGGLGTLAQIAGAVKTIGNTVGSTHSQKREQEQALEQLQQRQQLQKLQLEQDTALERERMAVQGKQQEDERQAALRRAVARQRAQFGASGVSSGAGSSQAVLLGLFDESDEERAHREQLDKLRSRALDLDLSNTQSVNVLQREQLRQRQNLQSTISNFNRIF